MENQYAGLLKNKLFVNLIAKAGVSYAELERIIGEMTEYSVNDLSSILEDPTVVGLTKDSKEIKVAEAVVSRAKQSQTTQTQAKAEVSPQVISVNLIENKKYKEMTPRELVNEGAKTNFADDTLLDALQEVLHRNIVFVIDAKTKVIDSELTKSLLMGIIKGKDVAETFLPSGKILKERKTEEKVYILPNGQEVSNVPLDYVAYAHFVKSKDGELALRTIRAILSNPQADDYWEEWSLFDEDDKAPFIQACKKKQDLSIKDYLKDSYPDPDLDASIKGGVSINNVSANVDRTVLAKIIEAKFSPDEFDTLCFGFGIDAYDFNKGTKAANARDLVKYFERLSKYDDLVARVKELRPRAFTQ